MVYTNGLYHRLKYTVGIYHWYGGSGCKKMVFYKLIKRGIDNLRFALNLDDYVPDHIRQELTVERTQHRTNNIAQGVEKLIFDRNDDLDINNKFSLQTERFYNNKQQFRRQNQVDERLFSEIQGYNDIKELMMRCILSPEPVHVILDGPPASGKTIFLLCMQKKLYSSYFVDCTNSTGPGMIEYLLKHDVKYLLLDEVEKMSKNDQNVLLNVLETGALTSTKVRKIARKEMNLSVFATTNDIDSLSKPFRSRFMELSLSPYTFEDVKILATRYELDEQIALKIADMVWNKIGSMDLRDILQIARLTKSIDDVDFITETLQKYKRG